MSGCYFAVTQMSNLPDHTLELEIVKTLNLCTRSWASRGGLTIQELSDIFEIPVDKLARILVRMFDAKLVRCLVVCAEKAEYRWHACPVSMVTTMQNIHKAKRKRPGDADVS